MAGPCSPWRLCSLPRPVVPCLVWWLWACVGLWSHLSNLCFHGHLAFSYIDACVLSHFSRVLLFSTPWTVAWQAPLSMGFSRQEYWSGLPCPPPGDLPDPGIKPESLMSPGLSGEFLTTSTTWEAPLIQMLLLFSYSVVSNSLLPHRLQHARLPCRSPSPGVCSNSCPLNQWCHPTISSSVSPSPPAFNLSQNQGLFQWVSSSHQMAKILELQLQHQSFQWIFRVYKYLKYPKYEYLI